MSKYDKPIHVRIEPDAFDRLEWIRQDYDYEYISEVVRDAIDYYLKWYERETKNEN